MADLTAAVEAAARALAEHWAEQKPRDTHGQRCPVWTQKRPVTECACWILPRAREYARIVIDAARPLIELAARVNAFHDFFTQMVEDAEEHDPQGCPCCRAALSATAKLTGAGTPADPATTTGQETKT